MQHNGERTRHRSVNAVHALLLRFIVDIECQTGLAGGHVHHHAIATESLQHARTAQNDAPD